MTYHRTDPSQAIAPCSCGDWHPVESHPQQQEDEWVHDGLGYVFVEKLSRPGNRANLEPPAAGHDAAHPEEDQRP